MKRVVIESPFAGRGRNFLTRALDHYLNKRYARAALRNSLMRGEAPFASHLLYTQRGVLRDHIPHERMHGINAGLAWVSDADATVIYEDRGLTSGMAYGVAEAQRRGRPVEYRRLYK